MLLDTKNFGKVNEDPLTLKYVFVSLRMSMHVKMTNYKIYLEKKNRMTFITCMSTIGIFPF